MAISRQLLKTEETLVDLLAKTEYRRNILTATTEYIF